ncbi:MAG: hypothetical protein ACJ74U_13005 [Jatrophihabitantaceae bacterium]
MAAVLMLAALLASVALLARPAGNAGASTSLSNLAVDISYGCQHGHQSDGFVEVKLSSTGQLRDQTDPRIYQVGLATSPTNDDLYPDGGPTLVSLKSSAVLVRLTGPVAAGQHVFVRDYGRNVYQNFALPASCQDIAKTEFGLIDPDIYGNHQVTCAANSASMNLILVNNNDAAVDYTVLLVRKDGTLSGAQNQGIPVSLAARAKQQITITQPASTTTIYKYQVRVIAPDGQVTDVADVTMHCDSQQPGPHPSITPTPVRPSHSPSSSPSKTPSASHSPTHRPTHSSSQAAVTPSHSTGQPRPSSIPTSGPANGGGGAPGPATSSSASGPVLGDADTTSQPQRPLPQPTPSKKTIVEAGRVSTVYVKPGFTGGAVLVLLGFAGAMGGLLAANRASSRRR